MRRSCLAFNAPAILIGIGLCLAFPLAAGAEAGTSSDRSDLAPELLDGRKVLILDTSMHFALSSEFLDALEEWGRFERVFLPDEADLCFALSTRPDFTKESLPGEGEGTVRVIQKLYFKVFVPGEEETLWRDEVDLDEEDPSDLISRLRQRIEAEEAPEPQSADSTAPGEVGAELLAARTALVIVSSAPPWLSNEFRAALDDWDRFEQVFLPDQADVCFELEAPVQYATRELSTGAGETATSGEPPSRRTRGTEGVIETVYIRVFVPGRGSEYLWRDQIDAAVDEPARQLLERLRNRIAAAEASAARSSEGDD